MSEALLCAGPGRAQEGCQSSSWGPSERDVTSVYKNEPLRLLPECVQPETAHPYVLLRLANPASCAMQNKHTKVSGSRLLEVVGAAPSVPRMPTGPQLSCTCVCIPSQSGFQDPSLTGYGRASRIRSLSAPHWRISREMDICKPRKGDSQGANLSCALLSRCHSQHS